MALPQQVKKFTDQGEVLEDLPEETQVLAAEKDTRTHPLYSLAFLALICITIMVSTALITR
jgi:hypothetical protein